ncbi:WD40 repeat domain-containing protein, partial [Catellatospora coxensis]|uniref:WD40 repeat domain-containing protein n=1 Tax=Catellatospora coxensis TaxID=310354 RepID=UPI003CD0791E
VRIYNATTGQHLHTHTDHTRAVRAVAFANLPDGTTLLATGSNDNTVRIYNATTGQHLHTHTDHTGTVRAVAFADLPDGTTLLATASDDRTARIYNATTGQHLHTREHIGVVHSVALTVLPDGTALFATDSSTEIPDTRPTLSRISLVPHTQPSASESPQRRLNVATLAAARTGLAIAAADGLSVPLCLVLDILTLTGATARAKSLEILADHPGIVRLRRLGWPVRARVGIMALLLADMEPAARFRAPAASSSQLDQALRVALANSTGPPIIEPIPLAALTANADTINDQLIAMLEIIGPEAVATDPLLPLRLRHLAAMMPTLDRRLRAAVDARPDQEGSGTRSASTGVGLVGVARRGSLRSMLSTQLALPPDMLAVRLARDEVLYRLSRQPATPRLRDLAIVLDTTPPTFGPAESVLRSVVHGLVTALWRNGRQPTLVTLGDPNYPLVIRTRTDLLAVWTIRSLDAPRLEDAMQVALRLPVDTTVVLTTDELASEHRLRASPDRRLVTVALADGSSRRAGGPHHHRLRSRSAASEVHRVIEAVLAPTTGSD